MMTAQIVWKPDPVIGFQIQTAQVGPLKLAIVKSVTGSGWFWGLYGRLADNKPVGDEETAKQKAEQLVRGR